MVGERSDTSRVASEAEGATSRRRTPKRTNEVSKRRREAEGRLVKGKPQRSSTREAGQADANASRWERGEHWEHWWGRVVQAVQGGNIRYKGNERNNCPK